MKVGYVRISTREQNTARQYHFWADNGIYLGGILFPSNNQYMFDDKCLDVITKSLAIRWGLIQTKNIK